MFAPPEVIETRVVSRLPEEFYIKGRISGRYGTRKYYLEGPAMSREGVLYFTDVPWGRIFQMDPDARISLLLEYDGEPNGMKIHKDGRLFVADNRNGIVIVNPSTKKIEPFVTRVANERLRGPNDLSFSLSGDLYFTDQGNSDLQRPNGRVVRCRPDGSSEILLADIPSPNGLVLSPNEDFLYTAVTRTNNIWRTPLEVPPGMVGNSLVGTTGVFIQLSGGGGPDGMAVDRDGNIIVAHSSFGVVWVFSPIGEPLYRINTCAGLATSNVVFGGPDNRTLFITESVTGSILAAQLPTPGHPLYANA